MGKVFNRMFVIFGVFQYFGIQLNRLRSRLKHIPGKARRRRWRGKWRRSGKTISFFSPKDYDPKEDNFSKWTFCHVLNYHSTFFPLVLSRKRQTHSGNLSVNLCERILLFRTIRVRFGAAEGCEIYQCHCGGFKAFLKFIGESHDIWIA